MGSLKVSELTVLEFKPLFSIKLFYFHKGDAQEIYHTHSFNAISFRIFGNYIESLLTNEYEEYNRPRNLSRLIYIPKNRYHQITKSEGCCTLMITGPWSDEYKEYDPISKKIYTSTHGRKLVSINEL